MFACTYIFDVTHRSSFYLNLYFFFLFHVFPHERCYALCNLTILLSFLAFKNLYKFLCEETSFQKMDIRYLFRLFCRWFIKCLTKPCFRGLAVCSFTLNQHLLLRCVILILFYYSFFYNFFFIENQNFWFDVGKLYFAVQIPREFYHVTRSST